MPTITIPSVLTEAVKSRRVIPFLGAGASKEAKNRAGKTPPSADELRDILANKFFGKNIPNRDVMAVAEMAIANSGGSGLVYEAVRQSLEGFTPSNAHMLLGTFNWRMIATTNYDCLVERAYSASSNSIQTLIRFVKDDEPVEERMQTAANPVAYLKLHGCLDHIFDKDIPLVLSREQYSRYSDNRVHLFNRLHQNASESTLLFVGYRLDDPHIRDLIYKLESSRRPRWYIVTPDAEDYDVQFWATQNIEVIKARFGEFMQALDAAVPPLWRSLAVSDAVTEQPIRKFYAVRTEESDNVKLALQNDLTFVHAGMSYPAQTAEQFYSGYDTGWGCIFQRLDARRKAEEEILFTTILENEKPEDASLFLVRGPAGSGKTIALKRTAFEAATSLDALVLWLNPDGALRAEVFEEIHDLTKKTIFLFVDQVALHVDKVHSLLRAAAQKRVPLVVIAAERDADWNTYCQVLESSFDPDEKRIANLSIAEARDLIDLLERHGCLGLLKEKTYEERVEAFMGRADRQLLVALHELTQGKPFENIVFSEHQSVHPEQARQLYLDIATMHQFGVNIRAGTISRISGISFDDYQKDFLHPLENIVRIETDKYSGDYCYRTRHARVASLVFRQVCPDDASKAKQFVRLLDGIDAGYSSDRRALEEMTKGRGLAQNFTRPESVRLIYEAAIKAAPTQAYLHQQWAVFELNHAYGAISDAEKHAAKAHELDPKNKSIVHTQAEVDRRRANEESSPLLRESLRRRVRARLNELPNDRFTASSRCKLLVDEVAELSEALGDEAKSHEALFFAEKVKDAETAVLRAQQNFPDDADIIQVEARLRDVLNERDKALRALERAWAAGPRGSGLAIRVAKIYEGRKRGNDAEKILKEALARDSDDKAAHHGLALYYLRCGQLDFDTVEQHLRASFSVGDHSFEERYVLAEFLFFRGQMKDAADLFSFIDEKAPENFRKVRPRRDSTVSALISRGSGMVEGMKARFFFIRSAMYPNSIFAHNSEVEPDVLAELSHGRDVNFKISFNRAGPVAVDVKMGRL